VKRKKMKKQNTMVLFAIALLLAVIALTGSVQAGVNATEYKEMIEEKQPVNIHNISYVLKAVDEEWVKGSEYPAHRVGIWTTRPRYIGRAVEIMYWQKATSYLIDVNLNKTGYVDGNVTLNQWGLEVAEIPYALANESIAELFPDLVTTVINESGFISESEYKRLINANYTIDLNNIRFTGNAAHQEWIKGSTMNTNTLIYWDKYKKLAIILTLDSNGDVRTVDFRVNGKRAVSEIPWAPANQSLAKLKGGV
jgi:hypothetical protein